MKVVILAGDLGTRISEETVFKPKPMVLIGDKPILWHIMKIYANNGKTIQLYKAFGSGVSAAEITNQQINEYLQALS